ncbi:MAG: CoA transferase [Myxococcota bacterium]|nr:CoA transferase [Myxococcota bacterium]
MSGPCPLDGLRVIDCSTGLAGPYAGKLWVDAGADVIKVEPPGGDPMRRWTASGHALAPGEDGAFFQFLNASKRSVVADLDTEAGRNLLRELADGADLLLESFGAGYLEERGLGPDALRRSHPALSVVSVSPWGHTGPWAQRPATEFTLQAQSGSTGYRGLPERGPVAASGRIGEFAGGTYAALGGLAAWIASRRTGHGQHVDLSLFEAVINTMTVFHDLEGQWLEGPLAISIETPSIEPASDGWIGLCTYTGQQWKDFCLLIGRPEISEDDRFYDARARMEHLAFIQEAMHGWTRQKTVDEIVELASAMRIPVAPIGNGRNVLERDHFSARGIFQRSPHGFQAPRTPYRLSDSETRPFGKAPDLDANAEEIRAEIGAHAARDRTPEGGSALPLEGIRIVDLSAFWAGPTVTWLLAALGADVVKVESVQRPDGMRFAGAVRNEESWEWSWVFHGINTGKRGITLNLEDEEGKAILRKLIEGADAVVENFSVRVMEHFGLTWETLQEWNPRLSLLRMPAWGLDGPWRDRTGFAANVEQASGLAWVTGYRDMPLIVRGACDPIGGTHAAFALLLALEKRRTTGKGQLVECALIEPALNLAAEQVIEWTAYGEFLERNENRGPGAAPQGVYRCTDATQVAIAVASDAHWAGLVRALGSPDWAADDALSSAAGRRAAHDTLDAELGSWCAGRSAEAAAEALLAEGVPAAPLVNAHFIAPNPQLEARGFYQTLAHPRTGTTRYPGLPMHFSDFDSAKRRTPPPTLGQHNHEVLNGDLGISDTEIERLREAKVIGERPAWLDD